MRKLLSSKKLVVYDSLVQLLKLFDSQQEPSLEYDSLNRRYLDQDLTHVDFHPIEREAITTTYQSILTAANHYFTPDYESFMISYNQASKNVRTLGNLFGIDRKIT